MQIKRGYKYRDDVDFNLEELYNKDIGTPRAYPFTPDIWRLEQFPVQLLFVYDGWMSDRHQSFVVKDDGENLGKAFSEDKFDFLIKSTDPHKTAVAVVNPDGNRIQGEVFCIPSELFISLDKLKLNGLQSLRHRRKILYPYRHHGFVQNFDGYFTPDGYELPEALQGKKHWIGPEKIWRLDCWMYTGHPDYWQEMIYKSPFFFDRVPRFKPGHQRTWLDEYYRYQNP